MNIIVIPSILLLYCCDVTEESPWMLLVLYYYDLIQLLCVSMFILHTCCCLSVLRSENERQRRRHYTCRTGGASQQYRRGKWCSGWGRIECVECSQGFGIDAWVVTKRVCRGPCCTCKKHQHVQVRCIQQRYYKYNSSSTVVRLCFRITDDSNNSSSARRKSFVHSTPL